MNEIYKDTFIYKTCKELNIDIKELAFIMNRTLKCIENWRKDDKSIPAREKVFMNLMVKNNKLEEEVVRLQKHRVIVDKSFKPDLDGILYINENIKELKKLVPYRIVLEEI